MQATVLDCVVFAYIRSRQLKCPVQLSTGELIENAEKFVRQPPSPTLCAYASLFIALRLIVRAFPLAPIPQPTLSLWLLYNSCPRDYIILVHFICSP